MLRHCLHFDDVITFSLFRSGLQKKNSRKNTQGASTHGRHLTVFERGEGEKRVLSRGPRAISRNVGTELRKCPWDWDVTWWDRRDWAKSWPPRCRTPCTRTWSSGLGPERNPGSGCSGCPAFRFASDGRNLARVVKREVRRSGAEKSFKFKSDTCLTLRLS